MTIVDAHHHVWDLSVRDQDWIAEDSPLRRDFTMEDLAPEIHAAGVGRTVLVQTITVREETPEFLTLAAEHEPIAGVVGWTDLTRADIADELARLRELPGGAYLKGIRHQVQGEPDPGWLLRPDVRRGLAAVAEAGLVYDLIVLPHQLLACVQVVGAFPQLTFVLDHLGKPPIVSGALEPWASDLRSLAALPNAVGKLSGLVVEADHASWTTEDVRPYADTALEAFGPGRLMFGSDWPVCTLAASYGQVLSLAEELTASLGADEREQFFAGTATRVYGL
ncbi:amidohydrolase family protein [Streptomyces turgidiscabies]|uniref:Amidohydrolase family protein n=1 Tax=Streptomyces turgidiscabies (strain Car8) TaxID=698760 RepID=L7F6P7_STRT8|nr:MULTISPECIES: amidohydrolase family protein [Streptomyces]ELP67248.1 amidohydrolase family protein [Streptomyces turgidiscabies Car8]MDX3491678.1 amidohydrolase family protein [Streptomyces turgidiscabies]GAQ73285.1 amidohydrolase [Streptomyces turgidiscabies]